MKIAIHHREGSFSSKWIEYCQKRRIDFKLVNCLNSDIIKQLEECDGLMWHWSHDDHKSILFFSATNTFTRGYRGKGIR